MDDAIILSDDEECVLIEETTVVAESSAQKTCETSYSVVESVGRSRRRSSFIDGSDLDEEMEELNRFIETQRRKTSSDTVTGSEDVSVSAMKKRKMTDEQKVSKETAKRAREIEKEKKALERDQKKTETQRKRDEKEREKQTRKIEREISTSINSKCEQYTFCHVGKNVFESLPGLEAEIRMLFTDRKIENQLKIENDLGTRIEWRRTCIELKEDECGRSERFEYSSTQDLFAVVIASEVLKEVIASNTLSDFIAQERNEFQNGRCTMILVSFGKLAIQKKKLHNLALDIYEKHRAQIVQIDSLSELALFAAQYLRSLSRREKKRLEESKEGSGGGHKVQYQGEKGITLGNRNELVADWWSKMLSTIDRISDAQRRAIMTLIPDPIVAIDKYSRMDYSKAVKEIGDLVAENGRRVGPAMAHRIFTMLTDTTGNAVVD